MAKKFTQIPKDTFDTLQLDVGVLLKAFDPAKPDFKNEDIICATTGGINVTCTPTYSDLGEDVDNCPTNMMELKHLDSWACAIAFTSLSTSEEVLMMALGAADKTEGGAIVPRVSLQTEDFKDIWWVGDIANGGAVAVKLLNGLSTGGLSLQTTKNGKGQLSVTMTGHVSLANQNTMPMEFYSISSEVVSPPEPESLSAEETHAVDVESDTDTDDTEY